MPSETRSPVPRETVRTAVVVGAGVSGLMAAYRLRQNGVRVTVVEASHQVGGQVRTVWFAGAPAELGAEGVHLASPATQAVLSGLGLADAAVSAASGGTWVLAGRGLRRLPAGVGPAGPSRLAPVLSSRVLSPAGLARAALEPVRAGRHVDGDVSVGDFVGARFGRQVVDRLVDPLLGGIHAGAVRQLSLSACAPQLVDAARQGRSLTLHRRGAPGAGTAPRLVSWPEGLRRLVDQLASHLAEQVLTGQRVVSVDPATRPGGYTVRLGSGAELAADVVVLAVPAPAAAVMLGGSAPSAAHRLLDVQYASVATALVVLKPPNAAHPALRGTGVLVPTESGRLLRAATFVSTKWPHRKDVATVVRLSAGRAGHAQIDSLTDDELLRRLLDDLAHVLATPLSPGEAVVQRWPRSMPQQLVGHGDLVAAVRADLQHLPGIALAGASYDGVGIPACLRSGELAAERLLATSARGVPA